MWRISCHKTLGTSALVALMLTIQLIPIARWGPFFFGHDYGFYRRFVIQPFASFPNTPVPGLDHTVFIPRLVLDIIRFVVHAPDVALIGTYILFLLISVVCLYFFAAQYISRTGAYYAAFLYIISGIQFQSFQYFFLKEAIALPFFLLSLLFFERKRYALGAFGGICVVLSQQTSAILLLGMLGIGFLYRCVQERTVPIQYMIVGTAVLASYLFLHPHVAQKVASPPVGIFISPALYILWSVPLWTLAGFGITRAWPILKRSALIPAALTLTLAFFLFNLPFANRVYVFLDLFLTIPAALGMVAIAEYATQKKHMQRIAVHVIIGVLAMLPLAQSFSIQQPALSANEQRALPELAVISSQGSIITSPALLPWVQGWALAHAYAPGNLKEPHPPSDWSLYWTHTQRGFENEFLASFPQPLYVFAPPEILQYRPQCVKNITTYLFAPCSSYGISTH